MHPASDAPFDAPILSETMHVEPSWIDYNGHMNLAYYQVLFDRQVDTVFDQAGIGADYLARTAHSFFAAEVHLCYKREVKLGTPLRLSFQLLDFDDKRLHHFAQMHHAEEGWLACTSENLSLHIDMTAKKVVPLLPGARASVERLAEAHRSLPRPAAVGRRIAMRQG